MDGVDVVLALYWKPLWEAGDHVLPLAFHAFKGALEEAAATIPLNHVTRSLFSEPATYLGDSLTALGIDAEAAPRTLDADMQRVIEILLTPGKGQLKAAYDALLSGIATVSSRKLRRCPPGPHQTTRDGRGPTAPERPAGAGSHNPSSQRP